MLGVLLALMFAFPFLKNVANPLVLTILLAGVFLAAVSVTDPPPAYLQRAALTASIQVGLMVAALLQRSAGDAYQACIVLAVAATVVLIAFSMYCVVRYVLAARTITRDQIYAGICVYIMMGFAFGSLYYLILILDPASFTTSYEPLSGTPPDVMYFSFITLATVGYGDITPRTPAVRALAMIEAMVGVVYIAVFMARLVSLRSGSSDAD